MWFIKLFSLLPLQMMYGLADVLTWLTYYVFGYRKKIVLENLRKSFPDKNKREIKKIAFRFYRNLADIIMETLKLYTMSASAIKRRFSTKNLNELTEDLKAGKSVLILGGHVGNWEWTSLITSIAQPFRVCAAYQPLSSVFFDRLMLKIRSRFGAKLIKMNHILRFCIQNKKEPEIIALLADQSPSGNSGDYWTHFLNQETVFYSGGEKIAKKLNYEVYFAKVIRVKRGFYEVSYEKIKDRDNITENYVRKLEELILSHNESWLWSHRRWKHRRIKD